MKADVTFRERTFFRIAKFVLFHAKLAISLIWPQHLGLAWTADRGKAKKYGGENEKSSDLNKNGVI